MTDPVYEEVAAAGDATDVAGALVRELRQPRDEILRTRGRGDYAIYEKVRRDDQVYACLQQRQNALIARDWGVEPGGHRRLDKQAAEHLRAALASIGWDDVTKKMLNGIWYGFSVAEALYVPDGARVGLEAIKVRRPARFGFGQSGELRLRGTLGRPSVRMPEQKFWTYTANSEDDDDVYGRGLAHWCYWPTWLKRNGLQFWAIYQEKFAAPTAKGVLPRGASDEDRAALMQALRAATFDSAVVVPEGVEAELMQALRSAGGDYERFYTAMNAAITKVILSQTMTTDSGSSRSQAEVHEGVKLEVVKADADLICESFNRTIARWLTDWSYPGAAYPRVWREVSEAEDLKARADRDKVIFDMGYSPTQDYIDAVYGEGFTPTQSAPAEPQAQPPRGEPAQPGFAEPGREAETQRDDLADQLEEVARPHSDVWIDEIRRVLETSSDFGEAIGRLEALFPDIGVDELARAIGDGLAVANLSGGSDVADEADGL